MKPTSSSREVSRTKDLQASSVVNPLPIFSDSHTEFISILQMDAQCAVRIYSTYPACIKYSLVTESPLKLYIVQRFFFLC